MDRVAALSTGTKLLLAAGVLLIADLFATWQELALDYGPKIQVTRALDGWDFWGLLIGLLTLTLLGIVIAREVDDELSLRSGWELAALVLAVVVLAIAILKNVRDSESTWASYLGIAFAALMALGALMDWSRARAEDGRVVASWRPSPVGPSERGGAEAAADEPRSKW